MNSIAPILEYPYNDFELLWSLPALPLTERTGTYTEDHVRFAFDQELLLSLRTGHVQLRHQFDPSILYQKNEYLFRTELSATARCGVDFFLKFVETLTNKAGFSSIVDVGGNDLYLAKQLKVQGDIITVVDPVCTEDDGKIIHGVHVLGRLIEEIDLSREIEKIPDLIVCRHSLEHFSSPHDVITQWFNQCDFDCLYVVEVPCFDSLLESLRFDAIFHQHYHYFDLSSLKRLIWECGGEYLTHTYNYQGSCGGALLVAFRKAKSGQPSPPPIDIESRIRYIKSRISLYTQQMEVMSQLLNNIPQPIYGYGAGLMLATLAYHLKTDFSNLVCVLDDDPSKDGMTYENVPVTVQWTTKVAPPPDSSYIITSLENVRPIYRRIQELKPRRILVPLLS